MKYLKLYYLMILISCSYLAAAQDSKNANIIAASQSEASAIFFKVDDAAVPLIVPGNFKDAGETYIRNGLPNFFAKAKAGKKLRIAYIGGSITKSNNMYRLQSAKLIQNLFPKAAMQGINAGISGTDADLGACRLNEQVLKYKPDLLFIEFAVNGGFAQGVEGIIRQSRKHNPKIDLCLIYTVTSEQLALYESGSIPAGIKRLDSIASYYGITSIHMAKEAAFLASANKLIVKGETKTVTDKIVFSQDGVHPTTAGGDLYAAAIGRAMRSLINIKAKGNDQLPKPLHSDNWEDAKMLAPLSIAKFSDGWQKVDPTTVGFSQYANWFPYLMKAEKAGENFSFTFKGSMFGFFDIGGPEVGQLELLVDGKTVKLLKEGTNRYKIVDGNGDQLNRFNAYCNNRYRGQFINIELPEGKHTISFKIADEIPDKKKILGKNQLQDITAHPEKYNRSVIYLGQILIRGVIL
jgi:lysophospholipase L1-like esterase